MVPLLGPPRSRPSPLRVGRTWLRDRDRWLPIRRSLLVVGLLVAGPDFIAGPGFAAAAQVLSRVSVASNGSQANGPSFSPAVSMDGRFVAFHSDATNLVPGDTNGVRDVFVRDLATGATTRVSVASDGTPANGASEGGAL